MSSSESQLKFQSEKCKVQHDVSSSQHSSNTQQTLYFHSILCNPYLLENPASQQHSFMKDLFNNKKITKVARDKDYLTIDLIQKSDDKTISQLSVLEKYEFQNSQLKNELVSASSKMGNIMSDYQSEKNKIKDNSAFYYLLKQKKDKCIVAWHLPGLKLRTFSLSSNLLKLLDYKIDDLALDIQHLGAQAIDLLDGTLYKTSFLIVINSLQKFHQLKTNNDITITRDAIIKQSQTILVCSMKGRGNRKVTAEVKISMITEDIVCHEVVRILDQKEVQDNERKLNRENAINKAEQCAFSSLSKVAKLPRIVDPQNSSKICGYRQIKNLKKAEKQQKETTQNK